MKFFDFVSGRRFIHGALGLSVAAALSTFAPQPAAGSEVIGIAPVTVGAGPFNFDTAEQHGIRVDVLTRGLSHPFSIAFLPNADALIVERGARLRLLRNATSANPTLVETPIAGIEDLSRHEQAAPEDVLGIQDVAVHPDFAKNQLVYYTLNRPAGFDAAAKRLNNTTVLIRARLQGTKLTDIKELIVGEVVRDNGGSRILFGKDNFLYVSVGALSSGDVQSAQRTYNIYGKVLRIRDDGSIPSDNPFAKVAGARAEIYTLGHRDPLGLALDRKSGSIIISEHGPQGGDEINRILPGRNYGWPTYTYGTEYAGSPMPTTPIGPNTEPPLIVWMPAIAPSGTTFYDADKIPAWKNNLFVASSRRGSIDRTGSLVRIVVNEQLQEIRQETLLDSLHQRVRDVRQGPDGLLYVLTDEDDSVLMRISPAAR